ncbi:hypothetical protein GGI12_001287 [Dipsacomyces acuminosporus]|nr:hypothetical protein GGI12_001287 [Dipsacomyces acuminosporus]
MPAKTLPPLSSSRANTEAVPPEQRLRRKSRAPDKKKRGSEAAAQKPRPVQQKAHTSNTSKHRQAAKYTVLCNGAPEVWGRASTRQKLSLDSIRPSRVFEAIYGPSTHKKKHSSKPSQKTTKLVRNKDSHHKPSQTARIIVPRESVALPAPTDTSKASGPDNFSGSGNWNLQPELKEDTKQSQDPAIICTLSYPQVPKVHLPQGGTNAELARAAVRSSLVLSEFGQERRSDLHAHSISSDTSEEESRLRVYRVIGRAATNNLNLSIDNPDAQSPVMVTVAQDGGIVSGNKSGSALQHLANTSDATHSRKSPTSPVQSPPLLPAVGLDIVRSRSDGSTSLNSQGAQSFTTAKLFMGITFPEPPSWPLPPLPGRHQQQQDSDQAPEPILIKKARSEVSDIDVRRHLSISSKAVSAEGSQEAQDHVSSEEPLPLLSSKEPNERTSVASDNSSVADILFTEWISNVQPQSQLKSPPPLDDRTLASIAQTLAAQPHLPAKHSAGKSRANVKDASSEEYPQRGFLATRRRSIPHTFTPYDGSHGKHETIEDLMSRVSDLETRFTCVEAILTELQDEIAYAVDDKVGLLHNRIAAVYPRLAGRSPDIIYTEDRRPGAGNPAGQSKKDFDEATANVLSSIASIVREVRAMHKAAGSLEATGSSLAGTAKDKHKSMPDLTL